MSIQVMTDGFGANGPIPKQFTADGENASPPLRWEGLPPGTREVALIVDDPDAPSDEPFVHWVLYKIPPSAQSLPRGVPQRKDLKSPSGAVQGRNSFEQVGYGGPAPPRGHGTHHYHFRVYALDQPLNVQSGLEARSLMAAMSGHILDQGEVVGTYQR